MDETSKAKFIEIDSKNDDLLEKKVSRVDLEVKKRKQRAN